MAFVRGLYAGELRDRRCNVRLRRLQVFPPAKFVRMIHTPVSREVPSGSTPYDVAKREVLVMDVHKVRQPDILCCKRREVASVKGSRPRPGISR